MVSFLNERVLYRYRRIQQPSEKPSRQPSLRSATSLTVPNTDEGDGEGIGGAGDSVPQGVRQLRLTSIQNEGTIFWLQ
jgi:hypothetical protein